MLTSFTGEWHPVPPHSRHSVSAQPPCVRIAQPIARAQQRPPAPPPGYLPRPCPPALRSVVRWQLAKRRTTAYRGTTYSEKSGSGRKPFKQKGTGMARQGNKRAPLQRGGVKAHAPVLRQWAFKLNKQVRQLGMRVALSAKLAAGRVVLVDGADRFTSAKTADLTRRIQAVAAAAMQPDPATDALPAVDTEALLVVDPSEMTDQLELAGRALHRVSLVPQLGCTVLDLLKRDALIITPRALEALQARLA